MCIHSAGIALESDCRFGQIGVQGSQRVCRRAIDRSDCSVLPRCLDDRTANVVFPLSHTVKVSPHTLRGEAPEPIQVCLVQFCCLS